jgi:hypothetical protein
MSWSDASTLNVVSYKKVFCLIITVVLATVLLVGCSSDSKKGTGDLKKTPYCDHYREFDDKVATASHKEQLRLIKAITKAKSFPSSLKHDYDIIISGYEKSLRGESVAKNEKTYEDAVKRVTRHAIKHCDLLASDPSQGI